VLHELSLESIIYIGNNSAGSDLINNDIDARETTIMMET